MFFINKLLYFYSFVFQYNLLYNNYIKVTLFRIHYAIFYRGEITMREILKTIYIPLHTFDYMTLFFKHLSDILIGFMAPFQENYTKLCKYPHLATLEVTITSGNLQALESVKQEAMRTGLRKAARLELKLSFYFLFY